MNHTKTKSSRKPKAAGSKKRSHSDGNSNVQSSAPFGGSGKRKKRSHSDGNNNGNRQRGRGNKKKKFAGSDIDLRDLVKKADPVKEVKAFVPTLTFDEMDLHPKMKSALMHRKYIDPTEIQERAIGYALEGRDVIGVAQTGTGKTAAFLIPLLDSYLHTNERRPFTALIMVPTRELALQVLDEFKALTKGIPVYAQKLIGGTSLHRDMQDLRRKPNVIIGTPGRMIDLMERGALPLHMFDTLVIDEFDRMLDMGFSHDVMRLANAMENRSQNLLFSATVDTSIRKYLDELLTDPQEVRVSSGTKSADSVEQNIVPPVEGEMRFDTLTRMLNEPEFKRVILFAETKRKVSRLCQKLNKAGIRAEEIHGDRSQGQRQRALETFRRNKAQVLVATDVAARGIDIDDVSHVINYEVPRTYDSYIHRIGRTGRAGRIGKALTFVD